eukprot:TRINITY_DN5436_c0_g1_i1.p1 TRINITY_DN5436_c0_g1~~TRINITY_DN5436_c0_g1_i1.p1  ORF type:complete len:337 (+),score=105.05 TRINITY_DN5436_c0_g1_i1:148-1011(+)
METTGLVLPSLNTSGEDFDATLALGDSGTAEAVAVFAEAVAVAASESAESASVATESQPQTHDNAAESVAQQSPPPPPPMDDTFVMTPPPPIEPPPSTPPLQTVQSDIIVEELPQQTDMPLPPPPPPQQQEEFAAPPSPPSIPPPPPPPADQQEQLYLDDQIYVPQPPALPPATTAPAMAATPLAARSGWLTKEGGFVKSWKRRWVVLRDGNDAVFYYETQGTSNPKGRILLDRTSEARVSTGGPCMFEVTTPKRTYRIRSDSSEDMHAWISAINAAIDNVRAKLRM